MENLPECKSGDSACLSHRLGGSGILGFIAYIAAEATGKEQQISNLVVEIRWPAEAVVQLRLSSALMALARL
jgi:hypothetical protein